MQNRSGRMRSDAKARREALLDAAEECLTENGYQVPLEYIAERAGVGRGTLYRNFQDRTDLALAIFMREIDKHLEPFPPGTTVGDALMAIARKRQQTFALHSRLAADLPTDGPRRAEFEALARRAEALIEPQIEHWRSAGELAPHISSADFLMAVRMLSSLLNPPDIDNEQEKQLTSAAKIIEVGMRRRT